MQIYGTWMPALLFRPRSDVHTRHKIISKRYELIKFPLGLQRRVSCGDKDRELSIRTFQSSVLYFTCFFSELMEMTHKNVGQGHMLTDLQDL